MAANVQALCTSFKVEMLEGFHALGSGVRSADALKAALFTQNNSMGAATTGYSNSGEVVATSGYSTGGTAVTNSTAPASSGTTVYWTPSANIQWTNLSIAAAFDTCLIYNSSQGNRAICVLTFAAQTISAGTFTITMPSNGPTSALLQFN